MLRRSNVSKRLLARFDKIHPHQDKGQHDNTKTTLQAAAKFLETLQDEGNGAAEYVSASKWSLDSSASLSHSEDEILTPGSAESPTSKSGNLSSNSSIYKIRNTFEDGTLSKDTNTIKNKNKDYFFDLQSRSIENYFGKLDLADRSNEDTKETKENLNFSNTNKTYKVQQTRQVARFDEITEFHIDPRQYLFDIISSSDIYVFSDKKQPKARHPLDPPPALQEEWIFPSEREVELYKHFSKIEHTENDVALLSHGTLTFEYRKASWRNLSSGKVIKHPKLVIPSNDELYNFTPLVVDETVMEKARYQLPEYKETIDCHNCDGHLTLSCHTCSGQPSLTCFWCSGTGKKNMKESSHSICKKCQGRGIFVCRSCNDSGKQDCTKCDEGKIVCGLFIDSTHRVVQLPVQSYASMCEEDVIAEMQKMGDTINGELNNTSSTKLKSLNYVIEETQLVKVVVAIPSHLKRSYTTESNLPSGQKWKRVTYLVPASKHMKAQRVSLGSYASEANLVQI